MTTEEVKAIDAALDYATAFPTWTQFRKCMEYTGYVPTLRDDYGSPKFRKAIRLIRKVMTERGWKYFDGSKIVG
jgi:hypothetical protein